MSSTGLTTRLNCKAIPFIGESAIEKPPSPNGRSILSRGADVALPRWIFNGPSPQPELDHAADGVRGGIGRAHASLSNYPDHQAGRAADERRQACPDPWPAALGSRRLKR